MSLISINGVSHNFGGQDVFSDISFSIEHNSRIGLIGINGSGKTTLFNILTGRLLPHKGVVQRAKKIKIAYLSQEVELNEEETLYHYISRADSYLTSLHNKLEVARKKVAMDHSPQNLQKLQNLEENFYQAGGYRFASEMKIVLAGFGFRETDWYRQMGDFSGGEKTRIQFAHILLSPNDLLLLDEPTNHLDFTMIFWLAEYLVKQDKPYLIISHDRHFLDKTVNNIAEIRNKRIYITHGNYTIWEADRKNRSLTSERLYKRQKEFIRRTEDFIARNMAGQKVQQAKSRLKMLERLERIDKPDTAKTIKLTFDEAGRSGNDVFIFENASIGYNNKQLANNINLRIGYQDRIGLVGANGSGKTTLLKCLRNELQPLTGIAKLGASVKTGYYDQMHTELDDRLTVFDTMMSLMSGAEQGEVLGWLARFSFTGDDVQKLVRVLSGGEKARLYLARLIWQQPNFLILDEPTNHLDINTIEELEKALISYNGTVIFVSHDSYFIKHVASRIWLIQNKTICETDKDLEDVFSNLNKKNVRNKPAGEKPKPDKKKINPQILNQILADIEDMQTNLKEIDSEIEEIEFRYTHKDFYSDKDKILQLQKKHKELECRKSILLQSLELKETEYLEKSD